MTKEYWLKNITELNNKCDKYESGNLALTSREVKEMHDERYYWCNKCEHWDTEEGLLEETYQDEYSSWQADWSNCIRCIYCNKFLKKEYTISHAHYGKPYGKMLPKRESFPGDYLGNTMKQKVKK